MSRNGHSPFARLIVSDVRAGAPSFLRMFVRAVYADGAASLHSLQGREAMLPTQLLVPYAQSALRMRPEFLCLCQQSRGLGAPVDIN